MHGKETMRQDGMTERFCQKEPLVNKKGMARFVRSMLWIGGGYLAGLCRMLFETNPLGIALLCAGGNPISIFLGLSLAELALMENPVLMICTYAGIALIRVV